MAKTMMTDVFDFLRAASVSEREQVATYMATLRHLDSVTAKFSFTLSQRVRFTSAKKRTPFVYEGIVISKGRTKAHVRIVSCSSNYPKYAIGSTVVVPFTMLSAA